MTQHLKFRNSKSSKLPQLELNQKHAETNKNLLKCLRICLKYVFYDWTSASANIPHICTQKCIFQSQNCRLFGSRWVDHVHRHQAAKRCESFILLPKKRVLPRVMFFWGYLDRLFVNLVSVLFSFLVSFGLLFLWTSFGKISKLEVDVIHWTEGVLLLPVATTALWPLVSRCGVWKQRYEGGKNGWI